MLKYAWLLVYFVGCTPDVTDVRVETNDVLFQAPQLSDRFISMTLLDASLDDSGFVPSDNQLCGDALCSEGTRCDDTGAEPQCVQVDCADVVCPMGERCRQTQLGGICVSLDCEADLDCEPDEYCDGQCQPQVCQPRASRCMGQTLLRCADNGSAEVVQYECGIEEHGFTSVCVQHRPSHAACSCGGNWDCPQFMQCRSGLCVGQPVEPSCRLEAAPFDEALPQPEIVWGGTADNTVAADRPFGPSTQVVVTPLVGNLNDDNEDGVISELDIPDLIFMSFCESTFTTNGALRIVHGGGASKGLDAISVLGPHRWVQGDALPEAGSYRCGDGILDPTAPMALGDLDPAEVTDGRPEIVANHENGGLILFDNEGRELDIAFNNELNQGPNPAPIISNLDGLGFAEIVVGRSVITVGRNDAGELQFIDRFEGRASMGRNPGQGAIACVADILGSGRPQVIGGTAVYSWPEPPPGATQRSDCANRGGPVQPTNERERAYCDGELVLEWRGPDINGGQAAGDGYCAVADVLGRDQALAPSPDNPLDGTPELIIVHAGGVQIFNGQTGILLRNYPMGLGRGGGAPNVDDFDGDGFPEIGSAFESGYGMLDLQEPSVQCPTWAEPTPDGANETGTPRTPGGGACTRDADCQTSDSVCNVTLGQCVCLHNGWKRETEDNSSRVTGSTLFDFNGDGAAEVIYNDECWFRIYDGLSGQTLFKEPSESRTRIEYPVVADVDNDGNAEIVFSTSTESGFCSQRTQPSGDPQRPRWRDAYNSGLEVWGDPNDRWVSARRIWNQHAYHVTNIYEDGQVPTRPPESWQRLNGRVYNTYRSQPRSFGAAPDLVIDELQVTAPGDGCGVLSNSAQLTMLVRNQGDLRVGADILATYDGVWAGDRRPLLGPNGEHLAVALGTPLEAGQQRRLSALYEVAADPSQPGQLPDEIIAKIDGSPNSDFGIERECREDNNERSTALIGPAAQPDLVAVGAELMVTTCPVALFDVTVANLGSEDAGPFLVRAFAGAPDQGGTLLDEFVLEDGLAAGTQQTIEMRTNELRYNSNVRLYISVDPNDSVPECQNDNNLRRSAMLRCLLP